MGTLFILLDITIIIWILFISENIILCLKCIPSAVFVLFELLLLTITTYQLWITN